jgi:hypothetical protein
MRALYFWLINLHPRHFRERFGREMTEIFDEAGSNGRRTSLVADALVSLIRQRWLRPQPCGHAVGHSADHVTAGPAFHIIDDALPRRSALINGAIVTFVLLALMVFAIGRNTRFPKTLFGTRYAPPVFLPMDRAVTESAPTEEVEVRSPGQDRLYAVGGLYFSVIRVLAILDTDHERTLSAAEILKAPTLLLKLDKDHDGKLDAVECGLSYGESLSFHPALNALDADHNDEISAAELANSVDALKTLDKNDDGVLHPTEVLPGAGVI